MPKYDINDPTDLDILRGQFDMISHEEWEEYIELATERNIGYKRISVLKSSSRKAGISKYLSPKVISWVMSIIDDLEEDLEEEDLEEEE
ncbi:MAG: exodeoxyribonuclease V alpha subunit [Saprospiraceae bacterium]|jgi:exodeoxyribonuclease V alpha subunit